MIGIAVSPFPDSVYQTSSFTEIPAHTNQGFRFHQVYIGQTEDSDIVLHIGILHAFLIYPLIDTCAVFLVNLAPRG